MGEKDVFISRPSTTPAKIETSSTTPAMSTAPATTTIKTTEALTTRTNSDDFNRQLSFSTKTVVDLEIEWKSEFADRNSEAYLEVEKRILDVFENLREDSMISIERVFLEALEPNVDQMDRMLDNVRSGVEISLTKAHLVIDGFVKQQRIGFNPLEEVEKIAQDLVSSRSMDSQFLPVVAGGATAKISFTFFAIYLITHL